MIHSSSHDISQLRQQEEIDLAQDPAPDLVIEVDLSQPSLSKFPIFAKMRIQEVWRYHDNRLTVYRLLNEEYLTREDSAFLPGVTAQEITELIAASPTLPAHFWQRRVREYVQECRARHNR